MIVKSMALCAFVLSLGISNTWACNGNNDCSPNSKVCPIGNVNCTNTPGQCRAKTCKWNSYHSQKSCKC